MAASALKWEGRLSPCPLQGTEKVSSQRGRKNARGSRREEGCKMSSGWEGHDCGTQTCGNGGHLCEVKPSKPQRGWGGALRPLAKQLLATDGC